MTEPRFLSRRSFLAVAAAAAGILALGLVGCGEDNQEAKADRADAAIDWQYMTADELTKKLDVKLQGYSASAKQKIEAAGGKAEVVEL